MTDKDPILSIDVRRQDGEAAVLLAGELDPHSADSLGDVLRELGTDDTIRRVAVDLSGVAFIDSSGLRVLLSADEELAVGGATLVLRSPSEAVHRLLEITDLLDRLEIE